MKLLYNDINLIVFSFSYEIQIMKNILMLDFWAYFFICKLFSVKTFIDMYLVFISVLIIFSIINGRSLCKNNVFHCFIDRISSFSRLFAFNTHFFYTLTTKLLIRGKNTFNLQNLRNVIPFNLCITDFFEKFIILELLKKIK